jgi:hypothetical protein
MLKRVSNTNVARLRKSTIRVRAATVDQQPARKPLKNKAAVALGKLGGRKGGLTRAKNLTAAQRSAIAKKAAKARWKSAKKARRA